MPIPDIGVAAISIPDVGINLAPVNRQLLAPSLPPGVSMALPIVQYPGCVEAHLDSDQQTGLTTNDPDQVRIYCDAGMPSFRALDYQPYLPLTSGTFKPPKLGDFSAKPEIPATPAVPRLPQQPIATAVPDKRKPAKPRCAEGEFLKGGKCVRPVQAEPQEFQIGGKYLPPLEAATTTAAIATVATVSALMARPVANYLLKLIRPIIKKIINRIKRALGHEPPIRSVRERVLAQRVRNQLFRSARDLMG